MSSHHISVVSPALRAAVASWAAVIVWLCGMAVTADEAVQLSHEPAELSGTPGTPLSAVLKIDSERPWPVRVRIPAVSNLVLRSVERLPVQRTSAGRYVQERVILWQGLEAGSSTVTNICAEINGNIHRFAPLRLTVTAVEPTPLPAPEQSP